MSRAAVLAAASSLLLAVAGCVKAPVPPSYSGPAKAFKLLSDTPEAETSTRTTRRNDLIVTVENGEPVPAVVATGQIASFNRQGGSVRLYGDEAGKEGWSVDNFLLVEVVNAKGVVVERAAVGYQRGVTLGAQQIDTVGEMKFAFGPGEIDLSRLIPPQETVTLRVTALDSGGVGHVSDVYAILSSEVEAPTSADEELKNQ